MAGELIFFPRLLKIPSLLPFSDANLAVLFIHLIAPDFSVRLPRAIFCGISIRLQKTTLLQGTIQGLLMPRQLVPDGNPIRHPLGVFESEIPIFTSSISSFVSSVSWQSQYSVGASKTSKGRGVPSFAVSTMSFARAFAYPSS